MAPDFGSSVPRSVLLRRFSEFSTAGSFILLCLMDKTKGEKSYIVLENDEWYSYSQQMNIIPFTNTTDYTRYMVEHATECIPVLTETFLELKHLYGAPKREEFVRAEKEGIGFIRQQYLERVPWSSGYEIRDRQLEYDRSFLRLLLEMGLVVRRDCESGRRYVEKAEVEE